MLSSFGFQLLEAFAVQYRCHRRNPTNTWCKKYFKVLQRRMFQKSCKNNYGRFSFCEEEGRIANRFDHDYNKEIEFNRRFCECDFCVETKQHWRIVLESVDLWWKEKNRCEICHRSYEWCFVGERACAKVAIEVLAKFDDFFTHCCEADYGLAGGFGFENFQCE